MLSLLTGVLQGALQPKIRMAKKPLAKRLAFALSPARAYRRAQARLRKVAKELYEVLLELFYFLTHGVAVFLYDKTLPVTSRLFSRCVGQRCTATCWHSQGPAGTGRGPVVSFAGCQLLPASQSTMSEPTG